MSTLRGCNNSMMKNSFFFRQGENRLVAVLRADTTRAGLVPGPFSIVRSRRAPAYSSTRTSSNTRRSSSSSSTRSGLSVKDVAENHGVYLTKTELQMLQKVLDKNGDGVVTKAELVKTGKDALEKQWTRELCLSVIEKPVTRTDEFISNRLLMALDYGGTALFAIVGTTMAGEKNMNLIGCTLVGCLTALGGGTLNNLFYGSSSALLQHRPGVFWVQTPSYFLLAFAASVTTFYLWPIICQNAAADEMDEFIGRENLGDDGSVSKTAFIDACEKNPQFASDVAAAVGIEDPTSITAHQLFDKLDVDDAGCLSMRTMSALAGKQFNTTPYMYWMDTIALAAFSVSGLNAAIRRGMHPIITATSGITMCFGGIIRDLLCGRDIAIGGASYAFCTGAGTTMYVLCRELRLRELVPIPRIARVILAFSTTFGLRVWEYVRGEPLLQPMHGELVEKDPNVAVPATAVIQNQF